MLPHLVAGLNAAALALALTGLAMIRLGRPRLHRAAMLGAVMTSGLFLVAYLIHHASAPIFQFRGPAWMRPGYYTLLVSHVVLAAAVAPLVLATLRRALRGQFPLHRKLARWTLPLWLYVSASGIAVYLLLYHAFA
ncbi:MAG: DUF420 domain-containing protein [Solirubrobacterales bacterium]